MRNSLIQITLWATLFLVITGCNAPSTVAGGATTVESPYVMLMVVDEKNEPVENAVVELIPSNFDPCKDNPDRIKKQYSGISGLVKFDSIASEELSVLVKNGSQGGYIASVKKGDTVKVSLQKVSSVTVPLAKSGQVRFQGTSLVGVYDPVTKTSRFDVVPAGLYTALIVGDLTPTIIDSVLINPGTSQVIDPQTNGLRIEQLELPLALTQGMPLQISAGGSRNWVGTQSSGIWYQDSIGWHQVDLSSPEFAPFRNIPINKLSSSGVIPSGMNSEIVVAATDSGSLIYQNGIWSVLETKYLPAMKGVRVFSVSVDSSGMILIAYVNALQHFDPYSNSWSSEAGLLGASYVLAGSPAYVGFSNGTIKRVTDFSNISTAIMGVKGGWPINDLCISKSGQLYAGVENGLYSITDTQNSQIISTIVPVIEVESGPSETVWALTSDGVISVQIRDSTHVLRDFGGIFRSNDISIDPHGTLFACGQNGIVKITNQ